MKCNNFLLLAAALGFASAYPDYEKDGGGWGGGKPGTMGKDDGYKEYGPPPGYDYSPYPVTCVFEPEAQLQLHQCLMPGTAICRDGWAFGIDEKNGHVKLWKDDKVLFKEWPGAKKLCIGEKGGYRSLRASSTSSYWWYDVEIPYLHVDYDHGHSKAYLYCEGVGREDKDALLKIVDLGEEYLYEEPVVKFKKGPGFENALWWINAKGDALAGPGCEWYIDTKAPSPTPSASPSVSPSASPSQDCPLPSQTTGTGSCDGRCGSFTSDCWCDDACLFFEDCCADAFICREVGCPDSGPELDPEVEGLPFWSSVAEQLEDTARVWRGLWRGETNVVPLIDWYTVEATPIPDENERIPEARTLTISLDSADGRRITSWNYPSDGAEQEQPIFSEWAYINFPDGKYRIRLTPTDGRRSRIIIATLSRRENSLECCYRGGRRVCGATCGFV